MPVLRPLLLGLFTATVPWLAGCGQSATEKTAGAAPVVEASAAPAASKTPAAPTPPADGLIADDGRTLWASPTRGEPIDLSIVPSESDLIVHLRPAALLASEEGRRAWRALGPAGEAAEAALAIEAGKPLAQIDEVLLRVRAGASYDSVAVSTTIEPKPTEDLPLLQRGIESLLEKTDRERHVTIIFSPRFLLGDGGSLLRGPWVPVRDLLLAQLRDAWAAASLSLHIDDQERLYWELRVVGNAAEPESLTALGLTKQVSRWGDELGGVVGGAGWSPYSRGVIERSPAMVGILGKYARRGTERRQAVVNGYAPPGAAHQLLLSAERIVAEMANPPANTVVAATGSDDASLADRLRRPVTISFRRESLETAVGILSDELGVPLEIVGRDLQLEGITRNQMLALDVTQMPAAEALVQVLRRANPDPLAEGPDDTRQRLVYVVGGDGLTITTRSAAAKRGDALPEAFQPRSEPR